MKKHHFIKLIALTLIPCFVVLVISFSSPSVSKERQSKSDSLFLKSPYIDSIKIELKECYKNASPINVTAGNRHYNQAYQYFLQLQQVSNYTIPEGKQRTVSRVLSYYSNLFSNPMVKYAVKKELENMNESITVWPHKKSLIEKDFEDGVLRVFVTRFPSKMDIHLANGEQCLWKINGGAKVQMTGFIPNHGYDSYEIDSSQTPIYLGDSKEFMVANPEYSDLELVFRPCTKQQK